MAASLLYCQKCGVQPAEFGFTTQQLLSGRGPPESEHAFLVASDGCFLCHRCQALNRDPNQCPVCRRAPVTGYKQINDKSSARIKRYLLVDRVAAARAILNRAQFFHSSFESIVKAAIKKRAGKDPLSREVERVRSTVRQLAEEKKSFEAVATNHHQTTTNNKRQMELQMADNQEIASDHDPRLFRRPDAILSRTSNRTQYDLNHNQNQNQNQNQNPTNAFRHHDSHTSNHQDPPRQNYHADYGSNTSQGRRQPRDIPIPLVPPAQAHHFFQPALPQQQPAPPPRASYMESGHGGSTMRPPHAPVGPVHESRPSQVYGRTLVSGTQQQQNGGGGLRSRSSSGRRRARYSRATAVPQQDPNRPIIYSPFASGRGPGLVSNSFSFASYRAPQQQQPPPPQTLLTTDRYRNMMTTSNVNSLSTRAPYYRAGQQITHQDQQQFQSYASSYH